MKSRSRHRYGYLHITALDMDEYVFYTNVGDGMEAVMRGQAMSNGGVIKNPPL